MTDFDGGEKMSMETMKSVARLRLVCLVTIFLVSIMSSAAGLAQPPAPFERTEDRPVCDNYNKWRNPYFGDLHVHTSYSMDALTFGGSLANDPWVAYRFALGEEVGLPPFDASGQPAVKVQLRRPLDFAAVTDHAEYLGEVRICFTPAHPGYDSPECEALRVGFSPVSFGIWVGQLSVPTPPGPERFEFCGPDESDCLEVTESVWEEVQAAADAAYDSSSSCAFTSILGYEWTKEPGGTRHRNVLFRNADVPELPVSYLDAPFVEELWSELKQECIDASGDCDVLAIPHNSNLSLGKMFLPENSDGSTFTAEDAARRAAMEPLVEIIQHKGSSECRVGLDTNDELCNFEQLRGPVLAPKGFPLPPVPESSFIRWALKQGLLEQEKVGVNPFQLGFVGGTDSHNSTPGLTQEEGYKGNWGLLDSLPQARLGAGPFAGLTNQLGPGGLTVIWAEENSRDALFSALRRREVYATSGTRPIVRFFGGYRYPENMCDQPSFVNLGYNLGVPMGGELDAPGNSAKGQSPRFAVAAFKDPGVVEGPGTQLQRIQIIKGWVEEGEAREMVYDVAGDPQNGATVDPDTGVPTGPGFDSLCTVWEDPEFDPEQPAFYYARILENPTWRWTTHECRAAGVDCSDPGNVPPQYAMCCDDTVQELIQERAWTSPIWYTPEGSH